MTNRHSRGGLDRHRVGDRPLCPCGGRSRLVRPGCGAERQRDVAATEGRARRWHRNPGAAPGPLREAGILEVPSACAGRETAILVDAEGSGPATGPLSGRAGPAWDLWSRLRRVSRSRRRMSRPAGPQARGGPGSSVPVRSVYPGRRARHLDGVSAVDRRCGLYRRSGHTQGPTPGWARRFTARLDISPDQCDP